MQSPVLSHVLAVEFPELKEVIQSLKANNAHFKHIMDQHEAIDKQITAAEEDRHPMSDEELKELKVKRLHLKEEMYQMAVKAK